MNDRILDFLLSVSAAVPGHYDQVNEAVCYLFLYFFVPGLLVCLLACTQAYVARRALTQAIASLVDHATPIVSIDDVECLPGFSSAIVLQLVGGIKSTP